jgi:hypothetical protein
MGSVFFEVDFGCGSPALVERTVDMDPSCRVPDIRVVHRSHTWEADVGLTSRSFGWHSSSVLTSALSSSPLRNVLPGAPVGLGESPKSRSRRRRFSDCRHLRLAPSELRTAGWSALGWPVHTNSTNYCTTYFIGPDCALLTRSPIPFCQRSRAPERE